MANHTVPADAAQLVDTMTILVTSKQPEFEIKGVTIKNELSSSGIDSTEFTCQLPLPNSISDIYSHQWNVTNGMTEEAMSAAEGNLPSWIPFNSAKKFMGRKGYTVNPQYQQTYEGTMPRNFDCEWAFVPKSSAEAKTIQAMVKDFKKASSANRNGTELFLEQPWFWTLQFTSALNDMIRFKEMVCTNVSVNYAPGGYSDYFHDHFPKQINVGLSFAEFSPMFREDWE